MSIVYNVLDEDEIWKAFKTASQSVASFIESRIMGCIFFGSVEDVAFCYSLHRRCLTALAGIPNKHFNFACRGPLNKFSRKEFVPDLIGLLAGPHGYWSNNNSGLQSRTYIQLCKLLGRPPLTQIALRQYRVIKNQASPLEMATAFKGDTNVREAFAQNAPFIKKLRLFGERCNNELLFNNNKPKLNRWFEAYQSLNSRARKNFVKASCDRSLKTQKPFSLDDSQADNLCRICGKQPETLQHISADHFNTTINSMFTEDGTSMFRGQKLEIRIELAMWIAENLGPPRVVGVS